MTMAHLAQSLSSVQLGGTSPGDQKIDMSKVKELMGQDQIEGLSYSAKELLKTMDMQSSLGGLGSALPFAAMAKLASMQSSFPGPLPSPTTTSLSESASSVVLPPQPILTPPAHDTSGKDSEGGQYVTKAELAALEDRIMSNLDQKLAQMEKRILNALLSRKDSP
ncbi:hypothetical protein BGW38_005898 [Lunasporangiospora selenospora]|uniref:Uncharacterized protein n=1 Tax=Lunasporangiospora selenospora TaxID=979761 RepID=A0A9P6FPC2_9FUNG|nr:hypothetical protein BGW38_005898 [Lunasporangiospora selenospora]